MGIIDENINELIIGSDDADTLDGKDGNDTIIGNKGDDLKIGGSGDDRLIWNNGDGSDIMEGDSGDDVTEVNGALEDGDNFELRSNGHRGEFERLNLGNFVLDLDNVEKVEVNGLGGNDTLTIKDILMTDIKNVIFNGGDGDDLLDATEGGVEVYADGGAGKDLLKGSSVPGTVDTLKGGDDDDTVIGNKGDDIMEGGEGDDRLIWNNGDGSDIMEGDAGYDVVEVNGAVDAGDNFEIRANGDRGEFERLNLGNFVLDIDNVEKMEINGGGGDDTLTVKDISATDIDVVAFDGGNGKDIIDATEAGVEVYVDGGAKKDIIKGSSIPGTTDTLKGGIGDDTIIGNKGDDIMEGGNGNDRLIWNNGDGSDIMDGGAGRNDIVEVNGAVDAGDNFELRANGDLGEFERLNLGNFVLDINDVEKMEINGGGGDDTLTVKDISATEIEKVVFDGGDGNDILDATEAEVAVFARGQKGNDILKSGSQDDVLEGRQGNDLLDGGDGNDTLLGGTGNDTLIGGKGSDVLNGGAGADVFAFSFDNSNIGDVDIIQDFDVQRDRLQISLTEFGASSASQFAYDSSDGSLSYEGMQFATIETESSGMFDASQNIDFIQ